MLLTSGPSVIAAPLVCVMLWNGHLYWLLQHSALIVCIGEVIDAGSSMHWWCCVILVLKFNLFLVFNCIMIGCSFSSSMFYHMMIYRAWYCYGKSSVSLSMTLRYRDHIGWNSSKIISRLVSLGCMLSADPNITYLLQRERPKILFNLMLARSVLQRPWPFRTWSKFKQSPECRRKHAALCGFLETARL